nr:hypothetical protein [Mucilaginibacter sp. X5P1]
MIMLYKKTHEVNTAYSESIIINTNQILMLIYSYFNTITLVIYYK